MRLLGDYEGNSMIEDATRMDERGWCNSTRRCAPVYMKMRCIHPELHSFPSTHVEREAASMSSEPPNPSPLGATFHLGYIRMIIYRSAM